MSMRPGLGPKLFLVLVTTTIVIGNYQRHRERTHLREQLVNGHKITRNVTRLQGMPQHASLNDLNLEPRSFRQYFGLFNAVQVVSGIEGSGGR